MPDQRYGADSKTIGELLSVTSPRIEVPEWQRSYSWTSDEVETFWQDLLSFEQQYPDSNIQGQEYFLGSTVLVTGGAANLLLDGQQRLATATILLSVLRDARRSFKADAATRLQNKYIAIFDDATSQTTPVLTLNVYDRQFFRTEVQDERADGAPRPKPTLKSHMLVRKARDYFAEQIRSHSEKLGGGQSAFDWNLRIERVLCNAMSVVVVSSSDEDNASNVFETLNDRGIGLSTPDLMRNLLLRRAVDKDARDRVVSAWQIILGIAEEANVDDFLRHYWVSHYGDVKARKLYREIREKVTDKDIDSVKLSLDMAASAHVYREIVKARDNDAEMQRLLAGVSELGAKVLYPALLSGYAAAGEDAATEPLKSRARALTTLFVRYNVIAKRESTLLESTVYNAAAALRADQDFSAAIDRLRILAPKPAEFVSGFRRASVSRIATARYILRQIELAKRSTKELDVSGTDRVHVEHIYPQKPEGVNRWEHHAAWVNRIGNLTLLGKSLNTSIKNGPFADKKEKGYKPSDLLLTQELLSYDEWTSDDVSARQLELSNWITDIWSFPGETPEDETAVEASGTANEEPDELPEVPE